MPLATAATGIGKQVVTHAVRTWLGARRQRAERDAELVDLVQLSVRDHFQQRKLVRQLEDLTDQIGERLRPVYEHDFRAVADNERTAALLAVVDALAAADLTDDTLFTVDVDPRKLARFVRERVPVRRVGLTALRSPPCLRLTTSGSPTTRAVKLPSSWMSCARSTPTRTAQHQVEDTQEKSDAFRERARAAQDGVNYSLVTARIGDQVVGFAFGYSLRLGQGWWDGLKPEPSEGFTLETGSRTVVLSEIEVRRIWQGKGIGRMVHDAFLSQRTEERATLAGNPKATDTLALYECWGWRRAGIVPGTPEAYYREYVLFTLAAPACDGRTVAANCSSNSRISFVRSHGTSRPRTSAMRLTIRCEALRTVSRATSPTMLLASAISACWMRAFGPEQQPEGVVVQVCRVDQGQ